MTIEVSLLLLDNALGEYLSNNHKNLEVWECGILAEFE